MQYGRMEYNLTIPNLHVLGDCVDILLLHCFSILTLTSLTN